MVDIIYSDILRAVYHTMTDGKRYRAKDLLPSVKAACGYTDAQMKEMTKGETRQRVEENVRWALTHLYGARLIRKVERGVYEIDSSRDKLLASDGEDLEKLVRAIAKRK
jgi:restriction endonuclease Mrr